MTTDTTNPRTGLNWWTIGLWTVQALLALLYLATTIPAAVASLR